MERRSTTSTAPLPQIKPIVLSKRQSNFPSGTMDVLEQVTKYCSVQHSGKWRGGSAVRNNELQHLIDSDLFCISADRRQSRLNSIQEIRVLQALCDYFNEKENMTRGQQYSFFETIFCGREGESMLHEIRILLLMKLCSLAVQYPCYPLLNHVSQWLQKIGSAKLHAQQFIAHITKHFVEMPAERNLHSYLMPLAAVTPEFVAYFIAYSVSQETLNEPLTSLLANWLGGVRSSKILYYIKQTPAVMNKFSSSTFAHLVVYDCKMNGLLPNPLHGITIMLYADWKSQPPLKFLPVLEMLRDDETVFDENTFKFHLHLAKKAMLITSNEIADFCLLPNTSKSLRAAVGFEDTNRQIFD